MPTVLHFKVPNEPGPGVTAVRASRNMTQQQLIDLLDVSRSTLQRAERDNQITYTNALALLTAAGLQGDNPEDLIQLARAMADGRQVRLSLVGLEIIEDNTGDGDDGGA